MFGSLADAVGSYFVNMDDTPVYFEPPIYSTVSKKGAKKVAVRESSSNNPRVSVCLAVTYDGK